MTFTAHEGDALELISQWSTPLDLVVVDPPYAFGGSGDEHAISATVACVLRETAKHLRSGSWMVVLCASSWRSISYMVESVRGIAEPVRVGTWTKPSCKTKVRTPGWDWQSITAVAMRKGPKNRFDIAPSPGIPDHVVCGPVIVGRRAQLPPAVARWAVSPYAVDGGVFLDPFAGSFALPSAAAEAGMIAHGFERSMPADILSGKAWQDSTATGCTP